MEPDASEIVIRLHGVTPDERDELSALIVQQSVQHGLTLEAEASGDLLGDPSYETILVVFAAIQASAEVIKTIHAIMEPWLEEQRRKSRASEESERKEPPIKAELVVDGKVLEQPASAKE